MKGRILWRQGHCSEFMPRQATVESSREGKWDCKDRFT